MDVSPQVREPAGTVQSGTVQSGTVGSDPVGSDPVGSLLLRTAGEQAAEFLDSAAAPATRLAYQRDWARFTAWCTRREVTALPADEHVVAAYLADAAHQQCADGSWRYAPATMSRWVAGVNKAHTVNGNPPPGHHPRVVAVLSGIRRERATPPARRSPLLLEDLRRVLGQLDLTTWPVAVAARRDACLLVMGFAGAFRRSELAGLAVRDVTRHEQDGAHVALGRSKTDQEGRGRVVALPYGQNPLTCAPCALRRWRAVLDASDTGGRPAVLRVLRGSPSVSVHICRAPLQDTDTPTGGLEPSRPLFRPVSRSGAIHTRAVTGHAINLVVKRRGTAAGLDPRGLGGHSLRAGFVTQSFRSGADAHAIMRQTGHTSHAMVEVYSREGAPLQGNAVTRLGL